MVLTLLAALAASPIPLAPGISWEYREAYTRHLGELDSTEEARTRFLVRGSAERPFVLQVGGADPVSAPVAWGDGWLEVPSWTGEQRLPLPLEVGRTGPAAPDGTAGWRVEAEEQVTVPAGTFRAFRCVLRTERTESVLWIAPGVGVVQERDGIRGQHPEIERVLLDWSGRRPTAK